MSKRTETAGNTNRQNNRSKRNGETSESGKTEAKSGEHTLCAPGTGAGIPEGELGRLELLELHAWQCIDEAETAREKLAALKVIADLVLTQTRLKKKLVPQEEVESVEFYEQELRNLSERVRLLSQRRRKS